MDAKKYLDLFASEAREHLEALSRELVELERPQGRAEALAAVFRHAHSVKGMAASLGLAPIEALAHRLEDVADVLRARGEGPPAALLDLLLAACDRLGEMVEAASRGQAVAGADELVAALAAAAGKKAAPGEDAPESIRPEPGHQARPGGPLSRLVVRLRIGGGAAAPAARAFLVHKKLAAFGQVIAARPTLEEIRAGKLADGSTIEATLVTPAGAMAVKKAILSVAEVAEVEIAEEEVAPPAPASDESSRTVRVKTELLDSLIDVGGELIILTSRLRELTRMLPAALRGPVAEGVNQLGTLVKDLHGRVMALRMTPLSALTSRLPRAVREIARKAQKEVDLVVRGDDISVDRAILDALESPLQHLLRNAIDHGIEEAPARAAAGKPARGQITVSARREKDRVLLTIADDGRGMDAAELRAAAVARGLISAEAASRMDDPAAWMLAALPGISTRAEVTDLSGRGVGMDVVKTTVEGLGGSLEIQSAPGKGTAIHLRLPMTVAVVQTLLAAVGTEVFALPLSSVLGAVERPRSDAAAGEIRTGDSAVPAWELGRLLGIDGDPALGPRPFVIVEVGRGRAALMVDRLLGQEDAVLKPVGSPLDRIRGIAGVTILGSGRPAFILDVPRLVAA